MGGVGEAGCMSGLGPRPAHHRKLNGHVQSRPEHVGTKARARVRDEQVAESTWRQGCSHKVLLSEIAIATVFTVVAVAGFKRNLWLVAGELAGRSVLDFFHHTLVHNTGLPQGWPGFCLAFDLTAAVFIGCVLAFGANVTVQRSELGGQYCFRALDLNRCSSAVGLARSMHVAEYRL